MVFSSTVFLFLFLPLVIALNFLLPASWRNLFLLAASLLFYAWGEFLYVEIMLVSIAVNYTFAILVERARSPRWAFGALAVGVTINLALLAWFKYASFLAGNLNALLSLGHLPPVKVGEVHLPLGISFFTFHGVSYIVDIHRRKARALKNPVDMGLYIALFPQLVAGPIIRFHDVASQITRRSVTLSGFTDGVQRFVLGLGKKCLLANPFGLVASKIFDSPASGLTASVAWLGILCYSLQIYFDFSGYSDMAIGLGRMFGFRFLENFNYPYIAESIQEFWRRWHISLSNWFRDYLYIPLGGNRLGPARTCLNLLIVFSLCGFWHGASWNFLIWGLWHGLFLGMERLGLGAMLARLWTPLRHAYTLLVVAIGWVFFRAATLGGALAYLSSMGHLSGPGGAAIYLDRQLCVLLVLGALFSTPVHGVMAHARERVIDLCGPRLDWLATLSFDLGGKLAVLAVLLLSVAGLAAGSYNPFIYFRF